MRLIVRMSCVLGTRPIPCIKILRLGACFGVFPPRDPVPGLAPRVQITNPRKRRYSPYRNETADCFAEILEFTAFIKLRVSHGDLNRPYEIPLGTVGVSLMLLPAAGFVLLLGAFSSGTTWVVSGIVLLVGWGLYPGLQLARRRQWCEFRASTLYEGDVAATAGR